MIGKLRGFIDEIHEDYLLIDVNGVGYLVYLSAKTINNLRDFPKDKEISLAIETVVREDSFELYGFTTPQEKLWFNQLNKVQGVGNKVALKILGYFNIEQLVRAIIAADVKAFSQVSGIGPKLAARIVQELKDTPKKLGFDGGISGQISNIEIANDFDKKIVHDAISALENLGYRKSDFNQILAELTQKNAKITLENLITQTLRELSKSKF